MSLRFGAGRRPLAIFAVVVVVMVVVAICCGPGWRRLTVAMLSSRMVECGLHIYVCVCMCVWQMGVVRVVAAACARARRGWVAWFPAADPSNLMVVVVVDEAGRGKEKSEGECEATKRPDRARRRFIGERERRRGRGERGMRWHH
jgi:hypothetical protein